MNKLRFTFFIQLFAYVMSDTLTLQFAKDYFNEIIAHHVVVFACWDPYDAINFSRSLMNLETSVTYADLNSHLEMEKILKVNYYKIGIFVDLNCPVLVSVQCVQFFDEGLRYNESYWWLIVTDREKVPEELFHTLPLNIATEMSLALRKNESFEVYDVYNPSSRHGGRLNVTYMGYWNIHDGLHNELTQYKYNRRGDLQGLTLNSSIVIDHPPEKDLMNYISNPIERHYDTMHRFNYGLIVQLRDYYNFTMNLKRGTTWGYKVNGTWNGILGDMVNGIVDISTTPFNYKKERLDVTDYTVQTWVVDLVSIFRHPQRNDLSNVFLKPFAPNVWHFVAIVGFVNWLLLYLIVKIEQHYNRRAPMNTLDTDPASETALIAAASICQQGLSEGPRSNSGRIVFLFLFLWALLLFQFYSASVVGSLLIEKPRFINTAEDLLHSNLEFGVEDIAYHRDFFEFDDDPLVRKFYSTKMVPTKTRPVLPYYSAEYGLKQVQRGGFAFQIDTATAYKFIEETFTENEICELAQVRLLSLRHTSTCVSKHSPFKKMVTYGMRLIMERGTAVRLRNIWNQRRPKCPESHSSMPVPVVIEEFSPAIFLLLFGMGVSCLVVLLEKWKIHRKKEEQEITVDEKLNSNEFGVD